MVFVEIEVLNASPKQPRDPGALGPGHNAMGKVIINCSCIFRIRSTSASEKAVYGARTVVYMNDGLGSIYYVREAIADLFSIKQVNQ